jgi:hypothetical protein
MVEGANMDDSLRQLPNLDVHGVELPTPEEGLVEAKRWLARTFRRNEHIWLAGTRYDPIGPGWLLDVVRQGAIGGWVRQRYMFDEAAQVLHYRGETALSDDEFRALRRASPLFSVAEWQDRSA